VVILQFQFQLTDETQVPRSSTKMIY